MARAKDIIKKYVQKSSSSVSGETLIIANHLRQMQLWMVRQGLRFFPKQDTLEKMRRQKIEKVIRDNKLDLYWYGIVKLFLATGSLLWYLRPSGKEDYEIHWFAGGSPDDSATKFKAYYKPGGRELQEVIIRYSYDDYTNKNQSAYADPMSGMSAKKWVRLKITAETIIEEHFHMMPSLYPDGVMSVNAFHTGAFSRVEQVNTLGSIPCVVSSNDPLEPGDPGEGEFTLIDNQIEAEDGMRRAMLKNVIMFGNGTLVTTRPAQQVLEQMEYGTDAIRPSWSSQNGFHSSYSPSTRRDNPFTRGSMDGGWGDRHVAKIIGNVQEGERFGYVFPDPINGDQWRFAQEYREGIHEALGGIDPLGMKSGMTFGEVKSLYGKVAATAGQKCTALWTYGLCKLLETVIEIEEKAFLLSYKNWLVTGSPNAKKNLASLEKTGYIPDDFVMSDFTQNQGMFPPGVVGLPPYGDREVKWKWKGPVFESATRDVLDLSIVVRNMQELGVGSLQAMEFLFPDKDPDEIENSLSGVPFRFGREVTNWIGSLLQLQQQLSSIPDPMNPAIPLAASINLGPIINQQILSLIRETSYGSNFNAVSASTPGSSGLLDPASAGSGWNSSTNGASPYAGNAIPSPNATTGSGYAAGLYPGPGSGGSGQYNWSGTPGSPGSNSGSNSGIALPDWGSLLPSPGASITGSSGANLQPTNGGSNLSRTGSASPYPASIPTSGIPSDLWGTAAGIQLYGPPVGPVESTGVRSKRRSPSKESGNK